jgi:hypothetical protein
MHVIVYDVYDGERERVCTMLDGERERVCTMERGNECVLDARTKCMMCTMCTMEIGVGDIMR